MGCSELSHGCDAPSVQRSVQSDLCLSFFLQASADGLGESGAKTKASPRPTKVGAPDAASSTRAATPNSSDRTVASPYRSAPLYNCISIHIYPSMHLSIDLSICLSIYLYDIYVSVYIDVYLCV
jgi:hypothetical protein